MTRMQRDDVPIVELIDLETRNAAWHWTTANNEIWYTLSGTLTKYEPFPGYTLNGVRQSNDLAVSVIDFVVSNTGDIFSKLMQVAEMDFADIKIGRVFPDTPNLGRMEVFQGKLGDHTYDRNGVSGQARNKWNSANIKWPYYNYQDNCVSRFGGTGCGFNTSSITLAFSASALATGSCTTLVLRLSSGTLSASYSAGRFDFGRLTVLTGANSGMVRTIRTHTGYQLGLSHPLPVNSFSPVTFQIFPGCRKRRVADCVSLYNNAENFLGFPWIPIQEDAF